jgi:hypothetical protein
MSFNTNMENPDYNHTINNESIQKPDTIVHLGITHHRNYRKTTSTQIQKIWKNPGAHCIVSWELGYMGRMD